MRIQLSRKERTNDLVRVNKSVMDKSLNNLDSQLSRTIKQTLSPSVDVNRTRPYN